MHRQRDYIDVNQVRLSTEVRHIWFWQKRKYFAGGYSITSKSVTNRWNPMEWLITVISNIRMVAVKSHYLVGRYPVGPLWQ